MRLSKSRFIAVRSLLSALWTFEPQSVFTLLTLEDGQLFFCAILVSVFFHFYLHYRFHKFTIICAGYLPAYYFDYLLCHWGYLASSSSSSFLHWKLSHSPRIRSLFLIFLYLLSHSSLLYVFLEAYIHLQSIFIPHHGSHSE